MVQTLLSIDLPQVLRVKFYFVKDLFLIGDSTCKRLPVFYVHNVSQNWAQDVLGLEFQAVVSWYVGAGRSKYF